MLVVENVTKRFGSSGHPVVAVDEASLKVETGQFVSIVGRSGSGKSTLMSMLGALEKPTSGCIEVDGEDITKLGDRALIGYRAKRVGFVFQSYNLIPNLSALENVILPMEFAGMKRGDRKKRAVELLEKVGIDANKMRRKPSRLSGGEQQRVAIARSLANHPKLILADEPTGNLDSQTASIIAELLHDLARTENTTIIVVTHDSSLTKQTDATYQIQDGKLSSV